METPETRAKLANAITTLRSQGREGEVLGLVNAYKAKYKAQPVQDSQRQINAPTNTNVVADRAKQFYGEDSLAYKATAPARALTNVGVGIGTAIGKAGLGLGQVALKGVGLTGINTKPLVQNIEKIKQEVYTKPFEKQMSTTAGKVGDVIGQGAVYLTPSKATTALQAGTTKLVSKIPATTKVGQFSRGALGVGARAGIEGAMAGATGFAMTGGDVERLKSDAKIAGGTSAVLGSLGALGRGVKDSGLLKSVYSKTTGINKEAFNAIEEGGLNLNATPEDALAKSRQAVFNLRNKNTAFWKSQIPKIADEFNGVRTGLSDSQISRYAKVVDEFGVDPELIPKDLKNLSAIESLNLMKGLNELDSLAVKQSPKGAFVRQLKRELKDKVINNFGGEKGGIAKLWGDYSVKSKILEDMDSIVRAYKDSPISTVTAKNRLMAIYDANKPEFLKAVKDIEKELGINLTRDIASTKFKNILPEGLLKADGGLPTKAGVVDKIIKSLFLPLTSPRLAGKLVLPASGEASVLGKRLLGNYENQLSTASIPKNNIAIPQIKAETSSMIPNIPKSIDIPKSIQLPKGSSIADARTFVNKYIDDTLEAISDPDTFAVIESNPQVFYRQQIDDISAGLKEGGIKYKRLADSISSIDASKIDNFETLASKIREKLNAKTLMETITGKGIPNRQGGFIKNPLARTDNLVQEAKKYKSAEEFVKVARIEKALDGFDGKTKELLRLRQELNSSMEDASQRVTDFASNKRGAMGLVDDSVIKSGEFQKLRLDLEQKKNAVARFMQLNKNNKEFQKAMKQYSQNKMRISQSQLIEIWNKANKSALPKSKK